MVKLSWGLGVLGNDKWKTRMKSARKKKKRDTTYTASSPHPPLLFENLIGKSLWSGSSGVRTPFFLFVKHPAFG